MIYGLLGGILWALDTVILSLALAPFDLIWAAPAAATFLHDSFSAIYLLLLTAVRKQFSKLKTIFRSRQSLWLIAAGILGGPIGMCGYVFSIQFLGPGLSAVLSCLYPAIGTVLSVLFLKEKFSLIQGGGLVLSIAGVMFLSTGGTGSVSNLGLGLICSLVCILGWGMEGVVAQIGMKGGFVTNDQALLIRQCTSAIVFGLVVVPVISAWPVVSDLVYSSSFGIIAIAAAAGTLSYLNYYKAIHLIGTPKAMPLNITYSTWALLFSFLILGTVPSLFQIFCAFLVLTGSIICAR